MSAAALPYDASTEIAAPRAGFRWLAFGYFAYAFVGTHPLADVSAASRADGSPLDRLLVVALFALALVNLWPLRREALAALAARPGFVAVSAIILASVAWSGYPDLTIRRVLLYLMLATAGLATALTAGSPGRLLNAMFWAFVAVIVLNCVATLAAPGTAITDIGVKGIYTQKNVAGSVAMVSLIVAAFWTGAQTTGRGRLVGGLALALIFGFLVITKSKTSLGLAVLAPMAGGVVAAVARGGRRMALLALAGLAALVVALFGLFAASGFDTDRALDIAIGDSSFTGRDELWAFARGEIAKRPWGGHGYGAFWDVGLANDPIAKLEPGTWLGDTEVGVINQAHNGYLDLSLNVGVPATVLAGLTVAAALFRALKRAHADGLARADRAAHGAFAALCLAYLIHNATEATLFLRGAPLWSLIVVILFAPARAHGLRFALCTHRRNALLRVALDSVLAAERPENFAFEVVVVDNSDSGEAAPVIAEAHAKASAAARPYAVRGLAAHPANISVARNAALADCAAPWLAFLDDDQTIASDWFVQAERAIHSAAADVLFGAIATRFEAPARAGAAARKLFRRDLDAADGAALYACGPRKTREVALTPANALFRVATTLAYNRFDPAFGLAGGEDFDLFCRLQTAGRRFAWAPALRAHEFVPASRLEPAYLRRRFYAGGQVYAAAVAGLSPRPGLARWGLRGKALAQGVWLAPRAAAALARGREARDEASYALAGVLGKLSLGGLHPLYRELQPFTET